MIHLAQIIVVSVLSTAAINANEVRTLKSPMSTLDGSGIVYMRLGPDDASVLVFRGIRITVVKHSLNSLKQGQWGDPESADAPLRIRNRFRQDGEHAVGSIRIVTTTDPRSQFIDRIAGGPKIEVFGGGRLLVSLRAWTVDVAPSVPWFLVVRGSRKEPSHSFSFDPPQLWNLSDADLGPNRDPDVVLKHGESPVRSWCYSGERWVCTGHYDGTVRVWDLKHIQPKLVSVLASDDAAVRAVSSSADGRWIVTLHGNPNVIRDRATLDRMKVRLRVWDLKSISEEG